MTDFESYFGYYDIEVFENGKLKDKVTVKNRIMDTVLSQLIGTLKGNSVDLEVEYLAIGDGTTPITDNDTQLDNELKRVPYITRVDGVTGEVKHTFILTETDFSGTINEIGIFGGSTASATANTGTLISRILWTRVKTSTEEIQFTRTDKIARG